MSVPEAKPKAWASLAYTVADDKGGGGALDAAAKEELKAICDAADFGQLSIAAQVDFKQTRGVFRASLTAPVKWRDFEDVPAEDYPLWRKIKSAVRQSTLRVQAEQIDLNAARAAVLEEFLQYGRAQCPADRHVIFFYGHAYGPMGLFYDREAKQRAPNTLRLNDLAASMEAADGRRAAIVVFRDCFMNTLETAYQIRRVAEFMIASQSEAPIAGVWPWLNFMAALMPGADSGDVAKALGMQLGRFLDDPPNRGKFADVPYSVIDLSAADEVAAALKSLVDVLEVARRTPERCAACAAALEAARVGYPDDPAMPGDPALLDVPTMCDNLARLAPDPAAAPAVVLGDAVRNRLVRWHHSQKGRYQGTSIYYKPVRPADLERSYIQAGNDADAANDASYYEGLALSEATGWHRIALDPLIAAGA